MSVQEQFERRYERLRDSTTLSDREAQAIAYKSLGMSAQDIAGEMDIEDSTVSEYVQRAREKARSGKTTWDLLETLGIVAADE